MPALLWLLFFIIILVLLFLRSRSRIPSSPAPHSSPVLLKSASQPDIAPAAEELRRRRAALLDRTAPQPVPQVSPAPKAQPTVPNHQSSVGEEQRLKLERAARNRAEPTLSNPPTSPPHSQVPKSLSSSFSKPPKLNLPPEISDPSPDPSPQPSSPKFVPLSKPVVGPPPLETFLAQVLRITLTPPLATSVRESKAPSPSSTLLYLPATAKDLTNATKELTDLEPSQVDLILDTTMKFIPTRPAEALSVAPTATRLPFILSAFAQLERRTLPPAIGQTWKRSMAAQIALLLLEQPRASSPRPNDLPVSHFITTLLAAESFPLSAEALTLVCEQMSLEERKTLFSPILQRLRAVMHRSSLTNSTFTSPLTALQRLTSCPLLCSLLVSEPTWLPEDCAGVAFETQPYFSPFLRVYAFEDRESIYQHFAGADLANYDTPEVQSGIMSLQSQVRGVQASIHTIVLALLRERSSREGMLRYLRAAVQANNMRTQLGSQVGLGRGGGCSHGFMLNLSALLIALTAPYTGTVKSPPQLDVALLVAPVFNNCTRVIMSDAQLNEYRMLLPPTSSDKLHFVSESFALAHGVMRVGLGPTVKHYMEFLRSMQRIMPPAGQPEHPQLKRLLQIKASMDVHVLDDMFIAFHMRFCGYTADWFLSLIYPSLEPWPPATIVAKAHNAAWEAVPESILEEMGDLLTLASMLQYPPTEGLESIVSLFVTLMLSPTLLRNPHLRPRLFSFLFPFTAPAAQARRNHTIDEHPIWSANLPRILLTVFADAEAADRDKYHLRREVSQLLRQERSSNPEFLNKFAAVVKSDSALGLRFSHLLVSDVLATFDETLALMQQVQEHEAERTQPAWLALNPQQRAERENAHSLSDNNARAYIQLFMEYLSLLESVAEIAPSIRTRSQIRDLRTTELNVAQLTAQLVNYLLDNLTRPHLLPAKTEKYNLDSLMLIGVVMNIAVLLGDSPVFVQEIAADDRSFNEKKFARILRFAGNLLPTQSEVQRFEQLIQRATRIRADKMGTEEVLAEAPDDYVDPISCAVMDDPVQLPTSGKVVDRATITRILLSKAADPFNRSPLTIDQVKDLPELKEKIKEWKEKQLTKSS